MAKLIRELAKCLKGTMQETEDWWHLRQDDDGALFVEHSWSHTKLDGRGSDDGERRMSLDEFLNEDHPWASGARAALRDYLAETKQ